MDEFSEVYVVVSYNKISKSIVDIHGVFNEHDKDLAMELCEELQEKNPSLTFSIYGTYMFTREEN